MNTLSATVHETFEVSGPVTLDLSLGEGEVVIRAVEGANTVEVRLEPVRDDDTRAAALLAEASVWRTGSTVDVHVPGKGRSRRRTHAPIRAHISVPAGSDLETATGSAGVEVVGTAGTVEHRTGSGDLRVERTSGDIRATVASGTVSIGVVAGGVRVQAASGNVAIESVEGELQVKSASGSVAAGWCGGDVEVSTASGSVRLGSVGPGTVRVKGASGDLDVAVRAGTLVGYDVVSASGQVRSDLAPEDGVGGGPRLDLIVRTASGAVTVRRTG